MLGFHSHNNRKEFFFIISEGKKTNKTVIQSFWSIYVGCWMLIVYMLGYVPHTHTQTHGAIEAASGIIWNGFVHPLVNTRVETLFRDKEKKNSPSSWILKWNTWSMSLNLILIDSLMNINSQGSRRGKYSIWLQPLMRLYMYKKVSKYYVLISCVGDI